LDSSTRPWGIASKGEWACRVCSVRADHLHHIVPRSRSRRLRDDVLRNGMPLCWACHEAWHRRYLPIFQEVLWDYEREAVIEECGEEWLNTYYPKREAG
jgi:predicted HNH restriction endonuclease